MTKEITIYSVVVIVDDAGNLRPRLCTAIARETAKQVRIVKRLRGSGWGENTLLKPRAVHRTPEDAVRAWRRSVMLDLKRHQNRALDCEVLLTTPIDGYQGDR